MKGSEEEGEEEGGEVGFQLSGNTLAGQDKMSQNLPHIPEKHPFSVSLSPPPIQSSALLFCDKSPVGKPTLWAIGLGAFCCSPMAWRALSTSEEHVYLGCGKAGFTTD